jgi:hypothetical protein
MELDELLELEEEILADLPINRSRILDDILKALKQ